MSVWILIALFFSHFVADFLCQSHWMALNKSKNLWVLLAHVSIHFIFFLWAGWKLALANMILHAIIDWNIWRGYKRYVKRLYEKINAKDREENPLSAEFFGDKDPQDHQFWNDHWFYVTIGFDQFLHASSFIWAYHYFGASFPWA